jgi:hypothetical protein
MLIILKIYSSLPPQLLFTRATYRCTVLSPTQTRVETRSTIPPARSSYRLFQDIKRCTSYRVASHLESVLGSYELLWNSTGCCCFNFELDFTAFLSQHKQIRSFIDGVSHCQQSMVTEDKELAMRSKRVSQTFTFFGFYDNTSKLGID